MNQDAALNAPDSTKTADNRHEAADAARQKAIWVASYPKSGNTWVRVFLHNLFAELQGEGEGAQDINLLHKWTGRESLKLGFAARLGKPVEEASLAEIAAVRPLVQADLVRGRQKPVLIKTHNAVANVEGHPTINFETTLAAIYILRNPLDVAISYAHHSAQPVDRIIEFMARPESVNGMSERHVFEYMGSWSFHVASWMSVTSRPVLILRYEDLLRAPERGFGRLAAFLRLPPTAQQLRRAIEKSSFEELARQEAAHGFVERPETAEKFFRKGETGQWREALTREQIAAVVSAHAPMMQRFGYLGEDCGAEV